VRALVADWHFHRKEFTLALTHIDRALELDPTRSDNYYNRGRLHTEMQAWDLAKADFRRFLATSRLPATSPRMTRATKALLR
jgi:tetratricopeptide (TPR) repeat protein